MYHDYLIDEFSKLFYNWPTEPKPPIDHFPIMDDEKAPVYRMGSPDPKAFLRTPKMVGYEIQMALAGFSEDEVCVWHANSVLHIEGDNKSNTNVASKFTCAFHHKISCNEVLDLSESTVELKNGILSIKMPIGEKKENRKYLFMGGERGKKE